MYLPYIVGSLDRLYLVNCALCLVLSFKKSSLLVLYPPCVGVETKVWLEKVIVLGSGPVNTPAAVKTKVQPNTMQSRKYLRHRCVFWLDFYSDSFSFVFKSSLRLLQYGFIYAQILVQTNKRHRCVYVSPGRFIFCFSDIF